MLISNINVAWYDSDLIQYQREREETEIEKIFEDRKAMLAEQGHVSVTEHLKPKTDHKEVPEWQQVVKGKKTEDYYNKLQELENEQILRESKIRDKHQYAVQDEQTFNSTMAKGMAQKYEKSL